MRPQHASNPSLLHAHMQAMTTNNPTGWATVDMTIIAYLIQELKWIVYIYFYIYICTKSITQKGSFYLIYDNNFYTY